MKTNLNKLTTSAMMIALAAALAYGSKILALSMPLGGTVTICSMLPILLIAYFYGISWGLGTAFVYSLVQISMDYAQIMSWGLTWKVFLGSLLFDYIIAYTVLGLAGILKSKKEAKLFLNKIDLRFLLGIILVVFIRLISHIISGTILFASWMPKEFTSPFIYAVVYNSTFLIPDMLICILGAFFVFKPLMKALNNHKI